MAVEKLAPFFFVPAGIDAGKKRADGVGVCVPAPAGVVGLGGLAVFQVGHERTADLQMLREQVAELSGRARAEKRRQRPGKVLRILQQPLRDRREIGQTGRCADDEKARPVDVLLSELPKPLHQADLPGGVTSLHGHCLLCLYPACAAKSDRVRAGSLAHLLRSKDKKGCNFAPDAL